MEAPGQPPSLPSPTSGSGYYCSSTLLKNDELQRLVDLCVVFGCFIQWLAWAPQSSISFTYLKISNQQAHIF